MSVEVLGIDSGSVAVGFVVIDENSNILQSGYQFHHGEVAKTLERLLGNVDFDRFDRVVATQSTPSYLDVDRRYFNELATINAARDLHPGMRGLLMVGGEKFSLARFTDQGQYCGSTTNSSCAAGTGSFLDQQAIRLFLSGSAQLSSLAAENSSERPQIASRCAVFAKTDLIHAQQEGFGIEQISDGLCFGLAKNIVDTLFSKEQPIEGELVFCGGVARNKVVAQYIEELSGAPLHIPETGHLYGAIGCSLMELSQLQTSTLKRTNQSFLSVLKNPERNSPTTAIRAYPPLSLNYSEYPDFTGHEHSLVSSEEFPAVEVDIYHQFQEHESICAYLGLDIGSTSTKAVLITEAHEVLVGLYTRTAGRPALAVQAIFKTIDELIESKQLQLKINGCGTTGSGRKFIGGIVGADMILDEITAHARAAFELQPEVDTIIEIGGQDAKFTTLQKGRVTSSTMNTVCAAGTGSFIEEQALKLDCKLENLAGRTEGVAGPLVSDRCTVFMERDVNHCLTEGYTVDQVLASCLHAVCENYLMKVASEKHIGTSICFQGATAKNKSLVAAFEQRLKKPILVSRYCHLTGALGTALILADEKVHSDKFTGFGLHKQSLVLKSEVCDYCTNHCKISVATVGDTEVAYGFLCGRDYHHKRYVKVPSTSFDFLSERKRLFRVTNPAQKDVVLGIPAALHLVEDLPMWQKFFGLLRIRTVTSESCPDPMHQGKKRARAEFCAPLTAMHGHVSYLLEHADYVFLPQYLENKVKEGRRQYCYYTQFTPALMGLCNESEQQRLLNPIIKYLYTSFHTKRELYRLIQRISKKVYSFSEVSQALEKAMEFQARCTMELKQLCSSHRSKSSDFGVVLLGRPYTVLSSSMNGNIPGILKKMNIDVYYQDMLEYSSSQVGELQPLFDELHWQHPVTILGATKMIAKTKKLYPIFLTSFMCSPDAFTLEYFKKIMAEHDKPYLVLQLDEHDSSVGYETRIEAAVRAFTNHHTASDNTGKKRLQQTIAPLNSSGVNPSLERGLERKTVLFPNWDRLTCTLLAATLKREGYEVHLLEESESLIKESLSHNSGQCIPLNVIAQSAMATIDRLELDPSQCTLWLNHSTLSCNIRLYPHHIKQIVTENGYGDLGVFSGQLSLADISLKAAMGGYFSYMLGGMLRKIGCKIRPYEKRRGITDTVLDESLAQLEKAFAENQSKEEVLEEIVSRFDAISTQVTKRPMVAIFGDLYARDNRVMNQDLVRFLEQHGAEVLTTPYSEYAKMIAPAYFKKWFNEGKYFNLLANRALFATMTQLEKNYTRIVGKILDDIHHPYDDDLKEILGEYGIGIENSGESMDNILKIHYVKKYYPEVALFVQTSPSLCCPSIITEAMRTNIEQKTGVPVVSVTYDGTGGAKNTCILPYLKFMGEREPSLEVATLLR